ncbi:MAG: MlaA family lipoprotein [Gammaproteobacteria bacterium]
MELRRFALVAAAGLVLVCASAASAADNTDPLEGLNRATFAFNDFFDRWFLKPVAIGYRKVTPDVAELGVSNFFANLGEVRNAANNLLQFKPAAAAGDVGRLTINSTIGIAGLFDVASRLGLERHDEDFGQTLGRWGVGAGPYLVLPFLGPSSLRDGPSLVPDAFAGPVLYLHEDAVRLGLAGLSAIEARAGLLDAEAILDEVGGDRYTAIRDAYLQRREFLVSDGEPSVNDLFEDFDDEEEDF